MDALDTPGFGADSRGIVAAQYDAFQAKVYKKASSITRLNAPKLLDHIGITPGKELDILDLGCGTGDLTVEAAFRTQGLLVATDVSTAMLDELVERMNGRECLARLAITHSHITTPGFLDAAFNSTNRAGYDWILLIRVLQHVGRDHVAAYIDELAGLLKPGGKIQLQQVLRERPKLLYAVVVIGHPLLPDGKVDGSDEALQKIRLLGYFPCLLATGGVLHALNGEITNLIQSLKHLGQASSIRLSPHPTHDDCRAGPTVDDFYEHLPISAANSCVPQTPQLMQRLASGQAATPPAGVALQLMSDQHRWQALFAGAVEHVKKHHPLAKQFHLVSGDMIPMLDFTLQRKTDVAPRNVNTPLRLPGT